MRERMEEKSWKDNTKRRLKKEGVTWKGREINLTLTLVKY